MSTVILSLVLFLVALVNHTNGACKVVYFGGVDPRTPGQKTPLVPGYCNTNVVIPNVFFASFTAHCNATTKWLNKYSWSTNPNACGARPSETTFMAIETMDVCGATDVACSVPTEVSLSCQNKSVLSKTSGVPGFCTGGNQLYCGQNGYTVQQMYSMPNCANPSTSPFWARLKQNECIEFPGIFLTFGTPCEPGNTTAPPQPPTNAGSGDWAHEVSYVTASECAASSGTVLLDGVIQLDQCFFPGVKMFCNADGSKVTQVSYTAIGCTGATTQIAIEDTGGCVQGGHAGSVVPYSITHCHASTTPLAPLPSVTFAGKTTIVATMYGDSACSTNKAFGMWYQVTKVCSAGMTEYFDCFADGYVISLMKFSSASGMCKDFLPPPTIKVVIPGECFFWDGNYMKVDRCTVGGAVRSSSAAGDIRGGLVWIGLVVLAWIGA